MKILEVTHRYPPLVGGVEHHVSNLVDRFRDSGHDVDVVAADSRSGTRSRRSIAPGDNYHFNPMFLLDPMKDDYDVVHVHNYHSFPAVFSALGTRSSKLVFTPHYHAGSPDGVRDILLKLYRLIGKPAMKKSDVVVSVTEWERHKLVSKFGVDPVVIPHGLDYDLIEPSSEKDDYLLFVGRLERYKGVIHAMNASLSLNIPIVIVGEGPLEEKVRSEIPLIQLAGAVSDDELDELYRNASVYLNLSTHEAFGMTVGEALARGTPSVVLNRRGLRRWNSTNGVVSVDSSHPKELSTAVIEAIGKETDTKPLPSWDEVADRTLEVFE